MVDELAGRASQLRTGTGHLADAEERQNNARRLLRAITGMLKLCEPVVQAVLEVIPLIGAGFQVVALGMLMVARMLDLKVFPRDW